MGLRRGTTFDEELVSLVDAAGANIQTTALLLRRLLHAYPEGAELARDIRALEHDGDRIAHDIIHRLNEGGTGPALFDSADGHTLATAVDDIVDYAEEAADRLGLYGIEAPMEQASALADVLVRAAEQVARALRTLGTGGDISPSIVEIHRLENEGDRIAREAVGSLFADGIDPMVVIRWKDIFESLECAIDSCERVAHILEGIVLKRRRAG